MLGVSAALSGWPLAAEITTLLVQLLVLSQVLYSGHCKLAESMGLASAQKARLGQFIISCTHPSEF